jgi:Zn finger protein HypA/HybF involved in hydrogenase expression/very-short-patch-repair endonuclease
MILSNDEFKKRFYTKHQGTFELLSSYEGAQKRILVKCLKCGHTSNPEAAKFLNRGTCKKCSSAKRFLGEDFYKAKLKEKYGEEFSILENFTYCNQSILIRHNKCGNTHKTSMYNLIKFGGCQYCLGKIAQKKLSKGDAVFKKQLNEITNGEYIALEEYTSSHIKMKFKHLKCGNVFITQPHSLICGRGCPKCGRKVVAEKLKTPESVFRQKVYNMYDGEYKAIGQYINTNVKTLIRHEKCGFEWMTTPHNFLTGYRCPRCSKVGMSHIEEDVFEFLKKRGTKFKYQYRIKECRNSLPLPFDFMIDKGNDKMLIELDGQMHYMDIYGDLEGVKERDEIKNRYCKENNITLIRIPYWEFNNAIDIIKKAI